MALLLLVGAGLMIKSFARINQVRLGFDRENVLTVQISLPEAEYDGPATIAFWRDLIGRVQSLPGVTAAGASSVLPVDDFAVTTTFTVENRANGDPDETQMANFRRVSPDYFRALGIPLKSGREFRDGDDMPSAPVAVVSERMAHRFWGDRSPIGKRLLRTAEAAQGRYLTVVGIVEDIQDSALPSETGATLYVPIAQGARPSMFLVAKSSVDPMSLVSSVRRAVLALDKDQPVARVQSLDDWVSSSLAGRRFNTFMLTLFAAIGMLLAVMGIYAVLSYSVSQRSHEIGVRMALGAQAGDVIRLILKRGMGLAILGMALGTAAALLVTRVLESLLFEVRPTDPFVIGEIIAVLMVVAFVASYLPARRAARFDPMVTLRLD
jgi:putative ABC transport system permease protein